MQVHCVQTVHRGVGEGGAVTPPTFESWGAQPLQFFTCYAPPLLNSPTLFSTCSYPSGPHLFQAVADGNYRFSMLYETCHNLLWQFSIIFMALERSNRKVQRFYFLFDCNNISGERIQHSICMHRRADCSQCLPEMNHQEPAQWSCFILHSSTGSTTVEECGPQARLVMNITSHKDI